MRTRDKQWIGCVVVVGLIWGLILADAYAQTIEELQAKVDSAQVALADKMAETNLAVRDSVRDALAAQIDTLTNVRALGLKAMTHPRDEVWVTIDLPVLATEDAFKKLYLKTVYAALLRDYKAKAHDDVVWRVHIRRDRAAKAMAWLEREFK